VSQGRARGSSALRTAPWTRAPLLLLRQPAVLAAVAGGLMVLGAAIAAPPLFLSSGGNRALADQVAERCQWTTGGTMNFQGYFPNLEEPVRQATDRIDHVGDRVLTLLTPAVDLARDETATAQESVGAQVAFRSHALEHVEVVEGDAPAPGEDPEGVWITDTTAGQLGLHPGDPFVVRWSGQSAPLTVTGVYHDLAEEELEPYWCSQRQILQPAGGIGDRPPPVVLTDRQTWVDMVGAVDLAGEATWELPLEPDGLTVDQAEHVVDELQAVPRQVATAVGIAEEDQAFFPEMLSTLPFVATRSNAIITALRGAVEPVAVAGVLTASVLVLAAGTYWVDRRRTEVVMLAARGVGGAAIGVKAALEMLLPAVVGVAAGWGLALVVVKLLGPTTLVDRPAVGDSLRRTAVALVVGVVLLGVVAGLRARNLSTRPVGARASWRGKVPWELGVLALAAWSYRRIGIEGVPVARGADVPRIDLLALAFPLLFVVGTVALAGRVLVFVLGRLRRRGTSWPDWLYLAARRLGSAPRVAVILVAASAMAVGVLVYAAALTRSLQTTLAAKARVAVGGDAAVNLNGDQPVPEALAGSATKVWRLKQGDDVDVIGVDPTTFPDGAFWDASFSGASLGSLLDRLAPVDPASGQPVPAIVAGGALPEGSVVGFRDRTLPDLQIDRVADVDVFPGMSPARPLVVVDQRSLAAFGATPSIELWFRGDPDDFFAELDRAGVQVRFTYSTSAVADQSSFATVSWAFGFMQSLGVIAGLITVGGLLLYLDTRQRSRKVSYAFLRRMGLSRRAHRWSLLVELLTTLVVGSVIGGVLACLAAWMVYGKVDPLPQVPPVPLLRLPYLVLAAVLAATLFVAWLGARAAQGSADRTNAAEVLRLGA
jgi:putative ABC transport system permease protein